MAGPLPKDPHSDTSSLLSALVGKSPTPDIMLDEALEKFKEDERLRPKLVKFFKGVATTKMIKMEGYMAAGFEREEAFALILREM